MTWKFDWAKVIWIAVMWRVLHVEMLPYPQFSFTRTLMKWRLRTTLPYWSLKMKLKIGPILSDLSVWPQNPGISKEEWQPPQVYPMLLCWKHCQHFHCFKCLKTGWGDLLEGTLKVSQYLMEVDLPIIGNRECEEIYSAEKEPIFKEQICAGYPEGGKDTCQVT